MNEIFNKIKQNDLTIIAGPCAVESEQMIFSIAEKIKEAGVHILRGGAFKMRTSVHDFQGLGKEGIKMLRAAADKYNLPIISEIVDVRDMELFCEWVDIIQVGMRNMYNYPLLRALGKTEKPVFIKRGMSATLEEYLKAVEYVEQGGNRQIILCERGVRGFDVATRNILDVGAIALLKKGSGYPVFADPSHAAGRTDIVPQLCYSAVAAGADGISIEVHENNEKALSDGAQAVDIETLKKIIKAMKKIKEIKEV